jgi:hypothetical protein
MSTARTPHRVCWEGETLHGVRVRTRARLDTELELYQGPPGAEVLAARLRVSSTGRRLQRHACPFPVPIVGYPRWTWRADPAAGIASVEGF